MIIRYQAPILLLAIAAIVAPGKPAFAQETTEPFPTITNAPVPPVQVETIAPQPPVAVPAPDDASKPPLDNAPPFDTTDNKPEPEVKDPPFEEATEVMIPETTPAPKPNYPQPLRPSSPIKSLEMEIAEVKQAAANAIKNNRQSGRYSTTLVSSRALEQQKIEIELLREAVACAKNRVNAKTISLAAFFEIQKQSINAELAAATNSNLRNAILRKAAESCRSVELMLANQESVRNNSNTVQRYTSDELKAVLDQRQHWEQLMSTPVSWSSSNSVSYASGSNMTGYAPSSPQYCRPVSRRRR